MGARRHRIQRPHRRDTFGVARSPAPRHATGPQTLSSLKSRLFSALHTWALPHVPGILLGGVTELDMIQRWRGSGLASE